MKQVHSKTDCDTSRFGDPALREQQREIPMEPPYTDFPLAVGQPFTPEDRQRMDAVAALIPGLSALLGEHCEIVLNSLENPEHSVLAAIHADISRRTEGSFISRRGVDTIRQILGAGRTHHRYFPTGPEGQRIKAVIIPILNDAGRCLGTLSIGMSLEVSLSEFIRENSPEPAGHPSGQELFGGEPATIIERALGDARQAAMRDPEVKARDRVRHVVRALHAKGIFKLRDAVGVVSAGLGVSPATIYLHLRDIKKEEAGKA